MKKIKMFIVCVIVLMISCQCRDAGGQQLPSQPPPSASEQPASQPPPSTAQPVAPPPQNFDVVKLADGREMVRVPAGEFIRGSEEGEADERPQKKIYLDEFLIDRYEVSNAQYAKCVSAKVCRKPAPQQGFDAPDQPVYGLSWDMANTYCRWAGLRLPTEAEWEKAARGTDGRKYPWGNEPPTPELATFSCKATTTVNSHPAGVSPYGAFNMAGNVAEWVSDWYSPSYYASAPAKNPTGPAKGEKKILRGGSYFSAPNKLSTTYRLWENPKYNYTPYGVRCAK